MQFAVFVESPKLFDAAAFGTSGLEAALVDPRQRLLLECAAEALLGVPGAAATSSCVTIGSAY